MAGHSPASTRPAAFKVTLACDAGEVQAAAQSVRAFLATQGWGEKELMSFVLALVEACTNAIKHAGETARARPILVEAFSEPHQAEFRVHDHTPGFDWPADIELPAPHSENGRGLYLIKCVMDHAAYFRGRDENILLMRKSRPAAVATEPIGPVITADFADNEQVINDLVEELSSCYESLSAIFRHSVHEARAGSLKEFAERLFNDLLQILSAEWFVVRLLSKEGGRLEVFATSSPNLQAESLLLPGRAEEPTSLETEAAAARQTVWFGAQKSLPSDDPIAKWRPGSVGLVQPILLSGELMGTLALGKPPSAKPAPARGGLVFTAAQTNVVGTFADYLAIQIANARFQEEQVRQRLVARELEIAGNIQRSLLPVKLPQPPGFTIAGFCRSAREVGGDFFDVLKIHDHAVLMVIADVMGNGIPAALFAAILSTVVRAAPEMTQQPAALLTRVNQLLLPELAGVEMFITMQLVHVDARARKITAASAGHCPLAVAGEGSIRTFAPEGMPLGVMADALFEDEVIELGDNSRVLLYTDGITDATNTHGETFGQQRLLNWLERTTGVRRTADQLKSDLTAEMEKFQSGAPLKDDLTFLLLAG